MNITKTTVQATTRKLSDSFNKEIPQEIDIGNILAEGIKKEIDNAFQHEIFKSRLNGI